MMLRLLSLVALLCPLAGYDVAIHEPDMGRRVPAPQPVTVDDTAVASAPTAPAAPDEFTAEVIGVIDGDTIDVLATGNETIHLQLAVIPFHVSTGLPAPASHTIVRTARLMKGRDLIIAFGVAGDSACQASGLILARQLHARFNTNEKGTQWTLMKQS